MNRAAPGLAIQGCYCAYCRGARRYDAPADGHSLYPLSPAPAQPKRVPGRYEAPAPVMRAITPGRYGLVLR